MDFWPQHKDFVLRVLAGFGVFLVLLIARGVVHGDDLERGLITNDASARKLKRLRLIDAPKIAVLEEAARSLQHNTDELAGWIGWNGSDPDVQRAIVQRALGYLRDHRRAAPPALAEEAATALTAMREDLNAGFGQLRDSLVDEADERNIKWEAGLGYGTLTEIQPAEVLKYLAQLELAARLVRLAIDGGAESIDDIRIETGEPVAVPDANPDFLREYPVRMSFRAESPALLHVLNGLETDEGTVPLRRLEVSRTGRGRSPDLLEVEIEAVAVVVQPGIAFLEEKKR
ncbi:MAG: hypothetical protein ACE5JG_10085 [Planctomycetota bacterium]